MLRPYLGYRNWLAQKLGAKFIKDWIDAFGNLPIANIKYNTDKLKERNEWCWKEIKRLRGVLTDRNNEIARLKRSVL